MLPERLDATYVAEDGQRHRPVMLHRAILGSFERFIGILIEHHAGRFPLWLAPVQAVVATIVSDADDYAREVAARLTAAGLRVEADLRNEKINYKVREHSLAKVPNLLVVGKREAEEGTVALRPLGEGARQEVLGPRRGGRAAGGGGDSAGSALTRPGLDPEPEHRRPSPVSWVPAFAG